MDAKYFEYIVVGCGGIGSATVYWLSKREHSGVLGLEQFKLGHDNGGSQDHSRIIRLAYPDTRYTSLTTHAYSAWEEVERESGVRILYKTGGLYLGQRGKTETVLQSYMTSMTKQGLPNEWLTSSQIMRRFPQFTVGPEYLAVYDKDSGVLDAALGNALHIQLARANGATVKEKCSVVRVDRVGPDKVRVFTTDGVYECRRLIVTAGAWINDILHSVGVHIPVFVTQEQVTYFATPHIKDFIKERFPVFIYHGEPCDIYALPLHGNSGFKIGCDAMGQLVTAKTRTFEPDPEREKMCLRLMQEILPRSVGPLMYSKTCLYTMTPDRHFVVDTAAEKGYPEVVFCCGAGHAFKFSGILGKVLSEMAIDGESCHDISGFKANRRAIVDPNFKPDFHMHWSHNQAKL